jgi:hypothetical protein
MAANNFARLTIDSWQQFGSVAIDFDPRLTVLTGANGSGKTTLLNLLARHADWTVLALAVPRRGRVGEVIRFVTRFFGGRDRSDETQIGALTYTNDSSARLIVPNVNSPQYEVQIEGRQSVSCFFVPSHRSVYRYQQLSQIPVARQDRSQAFNRVWTATRGRYFGGNEIPTSFHMKELLVAWSIFGQGNPDMAADPELLQNYREFEETLRKLLPDPIGFRRFSIRNLELILECESGDFMIDGASGGLSTIIDLAWQIFMFRTPDRPSFVVLIDEVENHLHPTMQRRLLPDLLDAFPTVQFIVSTHSPLIVTSVRDAAVYALRHYPDKTVKSEKLDFVNRATTAAEVLREVLGVETTFPVWAEKKLEAVLKGIAQRPVTENAIKQLRSELEAAGLRELIPDALIRAADREQQ